jgi:hypothetical protein
VKKYKWLGLLVMFGLLFSSLPVAAQGTRPPTPTPVPHRPQFVPGSDLGPQKHGLLPAAAGATSADQTLVPPIALGQPGLSFRYVHTFGTNEVGYTADTNHTNYPYGISNDGSNLWIGEMWGNRALKYNSAGTFQMQLGSAGFPDSFGDTSFSEITDTATDGAGNVWVVDDGASHAAKFDSAGNFQSELGTI